MNVEPKDDAINNEIRIWNEVVNVQRGNSVSFLPRISPSKSQNAANK